MEMGYIQELQHLSQAALEQLENVPASGSYDCLFSFWVLPSFADQRRVSVYTPRPNRSSLRPFVEFMTWRRGVDAGKFRTPIDRLKHPRKLEPTIETSTHEVTDKSVSEAIGELAQISLPCFRPHKFILGTDGTTYRFQAHQGYFGAELSWWSDGPPEWHESIQRLMAVVAKFDLAGGFISVGDS